MRESFACLTGALVCLLASNLAFAEAPASNPLDSSSLSSDVSSSRGVSTSSANTFTNADITVRVEEAKRLLQSQKPAEAAAEFVTLAALDPNTSGIQVMSLIKESFLTNGGDFRLTTQLGKTMRLHIVRPNGVNTAVTVTDAVTGGSLLPLLVKYPIRKDGAPAEFAYYTSAHPALVSPDVVAAGNSYLATMFDQAAKTLAAGGAIISPDIVEVAKHLVIVEHTDHRRFHDEQSAIYPEILSLYALNQGNTFRYSVSSAGAGGMIQMIPRTYNAILQHYPNIGLDSDFADGMRDHANALKAMLLYLDETWRHLQQSTEVQEALRSGIANKTELLAAGYNSNPYRLPLYLSKGGAAWRTLIPAETQTYLAIYHSVDINIQFQSGEAANAIGIVPASNQSDASTSAKAAKALISWVSKQLVSSSAALSLLP